MANKKFKDGNTLDSSQVYDANWSSAINNIIKYVLIGHQSYVMDLDTCMSVGVYPYIPSTLNIPVYGYGCIINIINWGAEKTATNWLWQIALDTNNLVFIRIKANKNEWSSWKQII